MTNKFYYVYTPDTIDFVQNKANLATDAFKLALDTLFLDKKTHDEYNLPFKLEAYVKDNADLACLKYSLLHYEKVLEVSSITINPKCKYPFLKIADSPFQRYSYKEYLKNRPFDNDKYVQTKFEYGPKTKLIVVFDTYIPNHKKICNWQLWAQYLPNVNYYVCSLKNNNHFTYRLTSPDYSVAYNQTLSQIKTYLDSLGENARLIKINKMF